MQNITIAGNIGKDAELRSAGQGQVAGFSVGVSNGKDRDGNWKDSTWFDCSLWGKRGETLARYLTKGAKVCVSGTFSTREHDGKTYLKINASEVTLMGKPQGGSNGGHDDGYGNSGGGQRSAADQGGASGSYDLDDEIPF